MQGFRMAFCKYDRTLLKGIKQVGMYQAHHLCAFLRDTNHLTRTIFIVEFCSGIHSGITILDRLSDILLRYPDDVVKQEIIYICN